MVPVRQKSLHITDIKFQIGRQIRKEVVVAADAVKRHSADRSKPVILPFGDAGMNDHSTRRLLFYNLIINDVFRMRITDDQNMLRLHEFAIPFRISIMARTALPRWLTAFFCSGLISELVI